MLQEAHDRNRIIGQLAGDPVRGFCLRNTLRLHTEEYPVRVLVDNQQQPEVLVLAAGAMLMVAGRYCGMQAAMEDLLHGRVEMEGGWPGKAVEKEWEREGRRYLFLNTAPYQAWRAAVLAGFDPHHHDAAGQVAYMWYIQGEPQFDELIKHSCRLGDGEELVELLKLGVPYDKEGWYIRQCVKNGPSFVCEVDGEPVCWSCTHLNRTMGMIYTPDEHRRKGFARSLAAYQIDQMLAQDGMAACHVIDYNVASMRLVAQLGFKRFEEPLVWRSVYWPGEAPPPEETEE